MKKNFMYRFQTLILHAATQLSGIYLKNPNIEHHEVNEAEFKEYLSELSLRDWMETILLSMNSLSSHIPQFSKALDVLHRRNISLAESIYTHIQESFKNNVEFVFYGDKFYPPLLLNIDNPPLVLNILGDVSRFIDPCVSVIGSRKAYKKTLSHCFELGKRFAQFKTTVVSGGAYGCDIAVHNGVLSLLHEQECRIIVVLAGGLSSLYPKGHEEIFRNIIQNGGAIVSERLWHQRPVPKDFSVRNRIISGLSYELIVMQAHLKSGSLQTAKRALDQGREVLVMRPNDHDQNSMGSRALINDGAYSFEDTDDLFNNYIFNHENILYGNW